VNRSAALHAPKASMMTASAIGSSVCVVIATTALCMRGQSVLPSCVDPAATIEFVALAAVAGFTTASVYICVLLAAKYVTGAEVGLVNLLESVLGPLWVFIGIGEVPTVWTFIGGSLLLVTLASHALFTSNAMPLECTKGDRYKAGTVELRRVDSRGSESKNSGHSTPIISVGEGPFPGGAMLEVADVSDPASPPNCLDSLSTSIVTVIDRVGSRGVVPHSEMQIWSDPMSK